MNPSGWIIFSAVLIACCFAVLIALLVPILLSLKKISKSLDDLSKDIRQETGLVLKDVVQMTAKLSLLLDQVSASASHAATILDGIGEAGDSLRRTTAVVKDRFQGVLGKLTDRIERIRKTAAKPAPSPEEELPHAA